MSAFWRWGSEVRVDGRSLSEVLKSIFVIAQILRNKSNFE
jgi:hypothetical protein